MKKLALLSLLFLLMSGVEQLKAQWIQPAQYQEMLGRGIDVDWWTDGNDYSNYDWDETASDFSDAGIRHIRITLEDEYMSDAELYRLDSQIRACINHGIAPIIAYRPHFVYSGMPAYYYGRRITSWWRAMAERYSGYPAMLSFDILIEPSRSMFSSYDALNDFYETCVTTIRVSNPYRILFIAPSYNSDPMHLRYLRIPSRAGGYLMAEWHFMPGSGYDRAWRDWNNRRSYAERWYRQRINAAMAWQRSTGILTWVGGWGSNSYFSVSYSSNAAAFTDFICSSLHAASIPFAVRGIYSNYNFAHRGWRAYAAAPMGHIFPHGGFARSGRPAGYRNDGFSIGDRRFGPDHANNPRFDNGRPYADRDGYVRPRGGRRDGQTFNGNSGYRPDNAYNGYNRNGNGFNRNDNGYNRNGNGNGRNGNGYQPQNNGNNRRVYSVSQNEGTSERPYRGLPQNKPKTSSGETGSGYQPRRGSADNKPSNTQQRREDVVRPMQRVPQQGNAPQRGSNMPQRESNMPQRSNRGSSTPQQPSQPRQQQQSRPQQPSQPRQQQQSRPQQPSQPRQQQQSRPQQQQVRPQQQQSSPSQRQGGGGFSRRGNTVKI